MKFKTACFFWLLTQYVSASPYGLIFDNDNSENTPYSFDIHGFGTIGSGIINENNLVEMRDLGSQYGLSKHGNPLQMDSRLGIQIDEQFNNKMSATIQTVAAPRVVQNFNNYVPWAFIKYKPNDNIQYRLGRLGVYSFSLSDQRNIGYVYPWVRPPVEFYSFMPTYSMTGSDITWKFQTKNNSYYETRFFVALSKSDYYLNSSTSTDNFDMSLEPIYGFNLSFTHDNLILKIAALKTIIQSSFPGYQQFLNQTQTLGNLIGSSQFNDLGINTNLSHSKVSFYDISSNYSNENWLFLNELGYSTFSSHFKQNMVSGYSTLGYIIDDNIMPFFSYSRVYPVRTLYQIPNNSNTVIENITHPIQNIWNTSVIGGMQENQYTTSLGIRYDFYPNFDIKMQVDRTIVFDNLLQLWNPLSVSTLPDTNGIYGISATFDFVF